MINDSEPSLLLTVEQAMRLLGVRSRNTMWRWSRAGHGPQPVNVGQPDAKRRTLRYRRQDVLMFIGGSRD
jgi:predicted DNA-binding transcriptional regulator AlpA